MSAGTNKEDSKVLVPYTAPTLPQLDLPSMASALREVYTVGGIPLALFFIAAIVLVVLLAKGVLETLPYLTYLIGALIAAALIMSLINSWLAYRKWRDETNIRLENRRLEMDMHQNLYKSEKELQDKFLLNIMSHLGELARREGSTPEGRREEIKFINESLGGMVRELMVLRGQLRIPEFTPVFPVSTREEKE